MNLILSRQDVDFQLFDWLSVEDLLRRDLYAEHDPQTLKSVLDLAEDMASDLFYSHAKLADTDEPTLSDEGKVDLPEETRTALKGLTTAGFIGTSIPASAGGMQLPFVLDKAAFAWFQAANAATSGYALLSMAAANLLLEHGTEEQRAGYVPRLADGTDFATMCLSEPQAGSSLSDIRTTAKPAGDGQYRIFGNKMWISGGDHELSDSITHLVLARTEGAPPGVKGLSLFLVPKFLTPEDGGRVRNDVTVAGLNHKMGQRGTVNAALNFGEGRHKPFGEAGAVGYRIGAEGAGLTCMFTMMNEARIAVGTSAAAIGYSGYLHALDYARSRPQGRLPGSKDPESPQVPIIQHTDVKQMLLYQKAVVEGALALNLYCARLIDDIRSLPAEDTEDARLLLELLTPVAKSWPSKYCLRANDLAIQVHGGYGYTRDYNAERLYRDNRLNPIHEGTHGIQGLDLLGRKVVMQGGRALDIFREKVMQACDQAGPGSGLLAGMSRKLAVYLDDMIEATHVLHAADDKAETLANSSAYLDAFGHLAIAWIWLSKLSAIGDRSTPYFEGKKAAASFFFAQELPKVGTAIQLLKSKDRTALDMEPEYF